MAADRALARKRVKSPNASAQAAKRARTAPGHQGICGNGKHLTVKAYRQRIIDQGKYACARPPSGCTACTSTRSCLHNPPKLPPAGVSIFPGRQAVPKRGNGDCFVFHDHPEFLPNLSPAEVMQLGSFGGTYFRDIESAVVGRTFKGLDVIAEFPKAWFSGLDVSKQVCSSTCDQAVNKYGVDCGVCLGQWETSGWISSLDPYGWFQWYCRFFLGRRSSDDCRQIGRFRQIVALRRGQLCNDIIKARAAWNDSRVSAVLRQSLQHWAYRLRREDFEAHRKKSKSKG